MANPEPVYYGPFKETVPVGTDLTSQALWEVFYYP